MRASLVLGWFFVAAGGASMLAQSGARDAFWSASDLVSVAANPGARSTGHAGSAPRKTTSAARSSPHVDPVLVAENGYGEPPHLVHVSDDQIGLRYSILLRDSGAKYNEVSPTAEFHSGDDLKLSVMANQPGYLYVIQQGSSGKWSPIYPAQGSAPETNKVEQGQIIEVPGGKGAFQFDTNPGQEKLFIVVSRRPIADLDNTIDGLKKPSGEVSPQQPAPPQDMRSYEASNDVPTELQQFASRDLNLVQVEDAKNTSTGGVTAEKAVYVVSKGTATSSGPQVVAALTLRHE